MERYVKTSLHKGNKKGSKTVPKQAIQGLAAQDDKANGNEEGPSTERSREGRGSRADSLIRSGTGRYAEELGDCIATEKGLLKRDDFLRIQ